MNIEPIFETIDILKGIMLEVNNPGQVQETINEWESYLNNITIGDIECTH